MWWLLKNSYNVKNKKMDYRSMKEKKSKHYHDESGNFHQGASDVSIIIDLTKCVSQSL